MFLILDVLTWPFFFILLSCEFVWCIRELGSKFFDVNDKKCGIFVEKEFLIGFLCLILVCISGRELRNRDIEGKRNPYSDILIKPI